MKSDHESTERRPQAVSRLGLYLPTGLLLGFGLLWSGFWLYSARLAEASITEWKAREAALGRNWSCADQRIGGYPFRLELTCSSLQFSGDLDGAEAHLTAGMLHAATQIYAPKLILVDLSGPLRAEGDGPSIDATWESARASIRFSDKLERVSIATTKPRVVVEAHPGQTYVSDAEAAEVHVRSDPNRPENDRAVDIAFGAAQISLPSADALTGSSSKMDMTVSGTVTQALGIRPQSWREMLDAWRKAGGVFLVDAGQIQKGDLDLRGKGVLQLDDLRRVQGRLDVEARGIGPLLTSIGGSSMSLILPLLQRKDGAPVQWPVKLQDGRIQIGPIRSGPVLGPLY